MLEHLLETEVARRPPTVRLRGRILFLTEDPDLIRRQLAGEDLEWDPSIPLRDDISTDEITPGWVCYHFDEKLGEYPYVGLLCGDERPIGRNDIRKGGFVCSVSGKRRGKGSSREASPYAERAAGLRVVIGENIERIYGENCANIGLLASTDFSLIEKIRRGEEIPLDAFIGDAGRIQRDIIEYGGLLDYAVARLKGLVTLPGIATPADRPQTIAEKIIARHWVTDAASGALGVPAVQPGDAGFLRADLRFSHEYVTPMASTFWEDFAGDAGLNHTESIVFFRDHLAFLDEVITEERKAAGLLDAAHALHDRQREFAAAKGVRLHGELPDRTGSEGICHIMVQDRYALPGQIIIGSDSHTPHAGALGCVAFGVGTSAIVNAWATRDVRLEVPESIRVNITGEPPRGVVGERPHPRTAASSDGQERRGHRPHHRVHGRGRGGSVHRRARDAHEHGGRGRGLHRHHRAGQEGRGLDRRDGVAYRWTKSGRCATDCTATRERHTRRRSRWTRAGSNRWSRPPAIRGTACPSRLWKER